MNTNNNSDKRNWVPSSNLWIGLAFIAGGAIVLLNQSGLISFELNWWAFFILIPLAVTSTKGWVKRLGGKRWARLHRLTYVAAILGVIHFWMIVKSDIFYPALFGIVLFGLLAYRLVPKEKPGQNREQ